MVARVCATVSLMIALAFFGALGGFGCAFAGFRAAAALGLLGLVGGGVITVGIGVHFVLEALPHLGVHFD